MLDDVQYTMIGVNVLFELLKDMSNYYIEDEKFKTTTFIQQ